MTHTTKITLTAFVASVLAVAGGGELVAQRTGFPAEEFTARREALARRLNGGLVLLFGDTMPDIGIRQRQDNDFYYFTGNEDLNAVLVMDAENAQSYLFLPAQNAQEIRSDGRNWLAQGGDELAKSRGLAGIRPLDQLTEFLARRKPFSGTQTVWVRMSEADEVDQSRTNKALYLSRRYKGPFGGQPSEDAWRLEQIRSRFPYFEIKDFSPEVDRLRVIKTPREIEILKRNGRLSAEAIRAAIEITAAGRFEYELEAEATYHLFRHGVQGNGYPAIVGSGPNVNVWHYNDNGKALKDGELVVMDYGGSLDYQVIDITRTWPVSGRFDDLQRRAYQCSLEAQQAIIAMMKPGVTRADTRKVAEAIYKKYGFPGGSSAGHFVGMSVHDVGDPQQPFEPGMVIAVEPIVEDASKQLHVRIEDTVLVTEGEPLVLSADVPKLMDEMLRLVGSRARGGTTAKADRIP
jgi:Xaa-Pro aminopeptidase